MKLKEINMHYLKNLILLLILACSFTISSCQFKLNNQSRELVAK